MKIKHIAFTLYPVKNMARARRFYEKVLGLKLGKNFGGKWVEYFPGGTGCFALTTMTGAAPAANAGGSLAFEVADIDKAVARLLVRRLSRHRGQLVHDPREEAERLAGSRRSPCRP